MRISPTLSALVVLSVACTKPIPVPDPGTESRHPGDTTAPDTSKLLTEPDITLALSPSLAGRRVDEAASGPWIVRSTVGARGDRRARSTSSERKTWAADSVSADESGVAEPSVRTKLSVVEAESLPPALLEPARAGPVVAARSEDATPGERAAPGSPGDSSVDLGLEKKEISRDEESEADLEPDVSFSGSGKDVRLYAKKAKSLGRTAAGASRAPSAPPLRAGSSDDNAEFDKYLEYLREMSGRQGLAGRYAKIDVAGRRFVRVLDSAGRPIPGADVLVADEARDRVIAMGRSYGDGRAPFYPPADEPAPVADGDTLTETSYVVQVRHGDHTRRVSWDGKSEEIVVELEDATSEVGEIELDVVFLIDTTGSMSDEIARIKDSLLGVTKKLRSLEKEFTLRYGAVLYRDISDQYVTKSHPFTSDIEAFDAALKTVQATGGGDTPESLNQGLAVAIDGMAWNPKAARVVFLIADAPPHMDYPEDTSYAESLRVATAKGIRVHAVAASGLDATGTLVFRQVAQYTRGKFIFIEYGSSAAKSAAGHAVKGKVESNNLDQILYEQIRDELAGWGRAS